MQRVCWMTLKCSAEPKRRDVAQIAVFEAEPVPLWLKDKIHPKWQESGFRYWAAQKYAEIPVSDTRFSLCPAGCVLWYSKLSDERYSRMAAKYEKEQAELLQSVSTKEKELAEVERESVNIRLLLAGLREYSSMETLTPEVVNKIIKRIEVHNSETVNVHKRVGIDIYFTGVGLVDLATIKKMLAIAESSRP